MFRGPKAIGTVAFSHESAGAPLLALRESRVVLHAAAGLDTI